MSYSLQLITAPPEEPVTFAELRQHCRIESTEEKPVIEALGVVARNLIEGVCRLTMMETVYEMALDAFPDCVKIPARPLYTAQDVLSVKYDNASGTEQTLSTDNYTVSIKQPYSSIEFSDVPETSDKPGCVRIRFVAGYGDAVDVPEPLKLLIKEWVATNFENRESVVIGKTIAQLPYSFDVIVKMFSAPEAI